MPLEDAVAQTRIGRPRGFATSPASPRDARDSSRDPVAPFHSRGRRPRAAPRAATGATRAKRGAVQHYLRWCSARRAGSLRRAASALTRAATSLGGGARATNSGRASPPSPPPHSLSRCALASRASDAISRATAARLRKGSIRASRKATSLSRFSPTLHPAVAEATSLSGPLPTPQPGAEPRDTPRPFSPAARGSSQPSVHSYIGTSASARRCARARKIGGRTRGGTRDVVERRRGRRRRASAVTTRGHGTPRHGGEG